MPPLLLFCDTDCLIQIFIAQQTKLLRWYKTKYGLEAVIVPEVEGELSWHAKFKAQFDADLRKAIGSGVISVFDYSRPDQQLSEFFPVPQAANMASQAIAQTGHDYGLRVGSGEAYSHAACIHLGTPLLSHDKSAIDTLLQRKLRTAAPVLRVFDLVGLAYQQGGIDESTCDSVRQTLDRAREWLPKAFARASFVGGLSNYDLRLRDRADCTGNPPPCHRFNDPLFLAPR